MLDEIIYIKNSNKTTNYKDYILTCKNSLNKYFDDVDDDVNYNNNHQTFIVNSEKYLIIIGININSQYLPPMVMNTFG